MTTLVVCSVLISFCLSVLSRLVYQLLSFLFSFLLLYCVTCILCSASVVNKRLILGSVWKTDLDLDVQGIVIMDAILTVASWCVQRDAQLWQSAWNQLLMSKLWALCSGLVYWINIRYSTWQLVPGLGWLLTFSAKSLLCVCHLCNYFCINAADRIRKEYYIQYTPW